MSIRDYDQERMQRIGLALYKAVLEECTDNDGVCFVPAAEVFDAMALLGGALLSTGPAARSATKLRELTTEFGKNVAVRARQCQANGAGRMFDVVLDEQDAFH
jgi:hypothetical protein